MHTNYTELSRRTLGGPLGFLVGGISHVMNGLLCSIHTHKVSLITWLFHDLVEGSFEPLNYPLLGN